MRKGQLEDDRIKEVNELMEIGKAPEFTEDEQGTVWFRKRICVPDVDHLREKILKEAHDSAYSIHPGSTKMHQDLKKNRYWWYGMECDVAAHVAICFGTTTTINSKTVNRTRKLMKCGSRNIEKPLR